LPGSQKYAIYKTEKKEHVNDKLFNHIHFPREKKINTSTLNSLGPILEYPRMFLDLSERDAWLVRNTSEVREKMETW